MEDQSGGIIMDTTNQSTEMSLIQTVRALDQTGPGAQGEHLVTLWRCLTSCSASQFHAAEQSALRWLLKVMSPAKPSPTAELVQRFPTTWRIMACVFERVPLFSLAKALADRKFVAVLRQTLERLTTTTRGKQDTSKVAALGKRKRGDAPGFAVDELSSAEGVLATADAVFDALRRLVERMRSGKREGGHARMGAEHVKSLFCLPVAEALTIVGPMLTLCREQLASGKSDAEAERWVSTICAIWDLHLQGQGDAVKVATNLAWTSCVVLRELAAGSTEAYAATWKGDLEGFLRTNLVLPSRGEFLNQKATGILTAAMDASFGQADVVGATLHGLTVGVYKDLGNASASDDDWIRSVFRVVEEPVRAMSSQLQKTGAILEILKGASGLKSAVDTADLQGACTRYGLQKDNTGWAILKEAAELDQTLFFVGKGERLLDDVCQRLSAVEKDTSVDYDMATGLALAVIRGFCTARNLQAFLKRWYSELAKAGDKIGQSVWFSKRIREGRESPLVAELEEKLSPQQIISFIEQLKEESSPAAQIVAAATLADGLSSEQFVDAIGTKLYDVVAPHLAQVKLPSEVTALGWRVVARTASWSTAEETAPIWKAQKKQLSRVLKKTPAQDVCALDAFRCVCNLWNSLYPDADDVEDVRDAAVGFLNGLEKSSAAVLSWEEYNRDDGVSESYVSWVLYSQARVVNMLPHAYGKFPDAIGRRVKAGDGESDRLVLALLANEALLDDASFMRALIDQVVTLLSARQNTDSVLEILQRIPVETYSREQRRNILGELVSRAKKTQTATPSFWPRALGLMVRFMRDRPTFYDGISFQDLVDIADRVGVEASEGRGEVDVLSALYMQFASIMIQQTAAYLDENKPEYFSHAARFVSKEALTTGSSSPDTQFMRLRLLEALLAIPDSAMAKFSTTINSALQLENVTAAMARGLALYTGAAADSSSSKSKKSVKSIDMVALHVAIDAVSCIRGRLPDDVADGFPVKKLEKHADKQLERGDRAGWKIKAFLISNFSSQIKDTRPSKFGHHDDSPEESLLPGRKWRSYISACVDAVLSSLKSREDQFGYTRAILSSLDTAAPGAGRRRQLFALQRALEKLIVLPDDGCADRFSFAALHSELAARLRDTTTTTDPVELAKTLELVHLLLDKKGGFMTQWSVESTLSAICVICTSSSSSSASLSGVYPRMCGLVETLIKRHRVRLEGHYHIVTTTLQCLLRALLLSNTTTTTATTNSTKESGPPIKHAHMFARLVTMLCVPTAGAVSRYHKQDELVLDSATASAKRFAGQYMYVVLMTYVKLLLDEDHESTSSSGGGVVGREVRDALEPGWNALFDVMPAETRRILNDGLDEGGREVVRDMWKRYTMFGKWSGV